PRMVNTAEFTQLVKRAREGAPKRKFQQSFELVLAFRDIDIKKQEFSMNEVVFLPHKGGGEPQLCVIAGGDLALRAKRAGADRVIEPDELDRLAADKRGARKVAQSFSFFLADTGLMPRVGRALGPYLGPRGRMPTPVPPTAAIEGLVARFRVATRVRTRGQLSAAARVGDETLADEQVAENAAAVLGAVEKKLPSGAANLRAVAVKLSMGAPAQMKVTEA
ncbi:MAG: 50S ribosomal protein L1, partial [Burkholderiales bacterium]